MRKLFPVFQYLQHWLYRVNEHSLHSPFLYDFYTKVLKADSKQGFEPVEQLRSQLLASLEVINIRELGAGSRVDNNPQRKVSNIARHASTPAHFSRLMARIIAHFEYGTLLELGTSLGLNTLHMHQGNRASNIYTFEGSPEVARLARQNFEAFGLENVQLIEGNLDEVLEPALSEIPRIDLVYMDANHRFEPTLRYFEQMLPKLHDQSLVVVDDIHWSKEMNQAWKTLIARPEVTLSLDLFEAGLLFFNPDLNKEHYVLGL